jgi:hypothetical protein
MNFFCLGWSGPAIFPISVSQVDGIAGMSHQHLATLPIIKSCDRRNLETHDFTQNEKFLNQFQTSSPGMCMYVCLHAHMYVCLCAWGNKSVVIQDNRRWEGSQKSLMDKGEWMSLTQLHGTDQFSLGSLAPGSVHNPRMWRRNNMCIPVTVWGYEHSLYLICTSRFVSMYVSKFGLFRAIPKMEIHMQVIY